MKTLKKVLLAIFLAIMPMIFAVSCAEGDGGGSTPPKEYTITVEENIDEAGEVAGAGVYTYLSTATLTATTNVGYVFNGWYDGSRLVATAATYSFQVKASKTVTAKWSVRNVSVRFDTDGAGMIAEQTIPYGDKAQEPTAPQKTGYEFLGWYNGTTAWNFDTIVTQDTTLTAKWQICSYTVTFNTDGGNAIAPQTVNYNEKATKPADPTKTGYTFTGWDFDFNTAITGDVTVNANWTLNECTVTFDTDGGNAIAPQTVAHGDKAQRPADPTKTGYTFAGWNFDFNTPITGDITVVALWTINAYTVTFNTDGGNAIAPQTVNYNEKATRPADPTKTGYTFAGWNYDFNTPITGDITVKASWTINEYTITFVVDGATHATQKVAHNSTISAPNAPTATGKTFSHWSMVAGGAAYDFSKKVTGSLTLYAVFDTSAYTLTVTASEGGSVTGGGNYDYGTTVTIKATPNTGYVFVGWSDGNVSATRTVTITSAMTLRANFEKQTYTIATGRSPTAGGTVTGGGTYEHGASVTLKATTNSTYNFLGWYDGGNRVSTNETYTFNATADKTYTAKWEAKSPVTTTMKELQTSGKLKILGRTLYEGNTLVLRNSASGFEVYTTSSYLKMNVSVSGLFGGEYMNLKVWVDGVEKVINLTSTASTAVTLAEGMTAGVQHHVKIAKMNEALGVGAEHANNCNIYVQSLTANYDGEIKSAPAASSLKIEIYGDSITCGYGALGNVNNNPTNFDTNEEDATKTFAYRTAMALGADINVVAHQGWAIGQSRWGTAEKPLTLPAIYDKVTDAHDTAWDFSSYTPDIVIVSLGTNDQVNSGLETIGSQNYTLFCWQYLNFLVDLHEKYPNAKFVLCYGMMDAAGGPMEHAIATWLIEASKTSAAPGYPTFDAIAVDLTGADGPYMSGGGSHPSAAQHEAAAANLQAALRNAGWID